tara:strand:- start:1975 stop:2163 length:189 start_codon:yes stop_codon:yes gene_type:complete
MKFNEQLALKNGAEKVKNGKVFWAWLLPETDGFRKMVAYARKNDIFWIHPEYQNGQNDKKKK